MCLSIFGLLLQVRHPGIQPPNGQCHLCEDIVCVVVHLVSRAATALSRETLLLRLHLPLLGLEQRLILLPLRFRRQLLQTLSERLRRGLGFIDERAVYQ
ncbi:hypothetical protein VB149_16765 [Xanthomonas fragariae]|nr:hypothetical protein [Xanthomonas fragariae]MEA5199859.1 hypothetical protein [Xanthomonas fragariae]